jgi:hypothetical protein
MTEELTHHHVSIKLNSKTIIGGIAAMLAILVSAITFINQAEIAEPHWVATRAFVRETIQKAEGPLARQQVDTQLYIAKNERSRIENEINNKQLLITQNPTMPQAVKDAIEGQVKQLREDLQNATQTIIILQQQKQKLE